MLAMLDFSQPFILECDASGQGTGAVLIQIGKPIAYLIKVLHGRNLTLSTYEKKLVVIIIATR